jgi:hypothetical protein
MNFISRHRHVRSTIRPRLESLETRLTPTAYTVSSLADSGEGSLRAAITSVNGDTSPDEIDFSVAGVIQLTSGALPALTNAVTIDGRTAPGFANAPVVEIDNNGFAGVALRGFSTLLSLSIVNANGPGVTLSGGGFTVAGNYIGLALDGSIAGNSGSGLTAPSPGNGGIGGTTPADRNVISGNGGDGIQLGTGLGAQGVFIEGNFIGTDPTGQLAAGNQANGISVTSGFLNHIGGMDSGAENTIAFNGKSGVLIDGGTTNEILSNSIFSNGAKGIDLQDAGNGNMATPQLSYAVESPGSITGQSQVQIGGVLNLAHVAPIGFRNIIFSIQVFATLNGVPAGQGQIFLGSVQGTTDLNGFATFTLRNLSVPAGTDTFTATATVPFVSGNLEHSGYTSEFSNPIGFSTANQAYVANVYQLLLNRIPDPNASVWVNDLNSGASPASVVLGVEASAEYLNDQVTAMYNLYLLRNPDAAGAQHWLSFLQAGGTLEGVAALLTASQEYFVMQGGTNQGFLAGVPNAGRSSGLYEEVLNRPGSNAEVAGWETVLDNGASRLDVSTAFLTSQEYRTNLVQADYMTFLQRAADQGGLGAWVNALNAGATDQQVLAQIFGSPEGYQLWS